jgi:hypothetical protein
MHAVLQSKFAWSGAASVLGPLIFIFFKVFSRSEFHPIQKQERRVTIGAKDPITVRREICYHLLEIHPALCTDGVAEPDFGAWCAANALCVQAVLRRQVYDHRGEKLSVINAGVRATPLRDGSSGLSRYRVTAGKLVEWDNNNAYN